MPKYPANPTYISGFHNNKNINGVDDRVYSALDMREPYKSIFSDGVKPNANGEISDDLQVQAAGGMNIRIAAGRGLFGGAFFYNKSIYTIELDTATTTDRYDCVIVHNNDTEETRDTYIYIKSLSQIPTKADLERSEFVNEYCLGYVKVPALATSISQSNIEDTRGDQNLCGWITGVFNQVDGAALNAKFETAFNEWFENIKSNFVAGATLIHTYTNSVTTTTAGQREVEIGIPQYNMNLDTLIVSVNGNIFAKGTQYEIVDNTKVRFALGFPVIGTQILFQVFKSVDGSAAEKVSSQVNTLINQMNEVNKKLEYDYICNGVNDNILIGDMVRALLRDKTDYRRVQINVIGTLGISTAVGGTGTNADPYYWFNFNTGSTRRAVVDFSKCGEIAPPIANGTYNVIFHSNNDIDIIGANIVTNNITQNTTIRIMNTIYGTVYFEKCRFWITAYTDSLIALRGTFINCRGSVANVVGNSYCFEPASNSAVVLNGGEYYSYTGDSTKQSAVIGQSGADAVSILYGVNAPTTARGGYYQTNSIVQATDGGMINCTDLISTLPMSVISGISNIRGTIAKNKPNLL